MLPGRILRIGKHVLILVLLLGLILLPRPMVGALNLKSARRFEAIGDHAQAASAYTNAAKRLFWRADLWQQAGLASLEAGHPEDAISRLVRAQQCDAITTEGWLALGDAYTLAGDSTAAMTAWENAGNVAAAYERLVKAHQAAGDFSAGLQDLRNLIAVAPENASAHFELGLFLAAIHPEDALPELLRAAQLDIILDPQVQSIRNEMHAAFQSQDREYHFVVAGRALAAHEDWDLAALAFRNASSLNPDYAEAWAWLGEAKQHLGQDGFPDLNRALSLEPGSAMVNGLIGVYYQRQGNSPKALAAYQAAVNLEPDVAAWRVALGGAYESNRDLLSALQEYQLAVELDPKSVPAWQALALYAVANDSDLGGNGLVAARKLMELSPQDWQSLDIAGQVTYALGNRIEARRLFEKVVELAPDRAAPHFHLALVYFDFRAPELALTELKLAADLDPNGPVGWQANRLLEQFFP